MDLRHGKAALVLGTVVGVAMAPTAMAATAKAGSAKAGGTCAKVRATASAGTTRLVCVRTGGKLRWQVAAAASSVAAVTTTTTAPANQAAGASPAVAKSASTTTIPGSSAPSAAPKPSPDTESVAATARTGSLTGSGGYRSAGRVELSTSAGVSRLAFVDATIQNGPALAVYLTPKAGGATLNGAVKLGVLKAQSGSFVYDIPTGTDTSGFNGVLIWCDQFSVAFGTAPLA